MVDRPDPAIYGTNAFYPASPVISGFEQWQRGRRLLVLHVFPFQYNPVTHTLRYHPDLQITIRVTPAHGGSAFPGDGQPEGDAANNPAAMTNGALRIRTSSRGLYRLTYDDLLAAGVPLATANPATFAMSYLGQPIDIQVTGDGDDVFEQGELVIFYAEPYQGRWEANNVYWFTYGGAPGARMDERSVTPTGSEPLITTITQTLQVERNSEYRSDYRRPTDADHWFDFVISPNVAGVLTATRTYDLALDDALTSGVVQLRATLQGVIERSQDPDQSIIIRLNSHTVGQYQWEGITYYTATATAPAAWLDGAPSRVSLVASINQLPGISSYAVAPDWVSITYPALADAEDDRIYIEGVASGANQVAVSGFTTPQVSVYDVRDARRPVRLLTTQAAPVGGAYTLSFWDADLPNPTYFLSSEDALLAPEAIEPDNPSNWATLDHDADFIAIVHRSLWDAIDPLLNHRADEGLRVAKVDVQDIYDEWSYGLRTPEAIRSFLGYAYRNWNHGGEPPQYVLLVGDGHVDFTGVSGTTLPNLIPPYLMNADPWSGETAADNRYVSLDGPDDFLPDMALGRIPANNAAELIAVVNKIIAYETTAPGGDWQRRVVYVADNNLDPTGDFHALSDDVRFNWLPVPYDDSNIYYNRDYFSGATMKAAIRAAFNADALFVQWFGHGSIFRWGSVTSMFSTTDFPLMEDNDTWPFVATFTCWNGYFINLFQSRQSLSEVMLLTPLRGAVGMFTLTGTNVGRAQLELDQGLTKALFRDRQERAGLAADAARLHYFGSVGTLFGLIDTSILLGDPALKLRLPAPDLSNSTLEVSPALAEPGDTLHYTLTLRNDGQLSAADLAVTVDYADGYGQVTDSAPPASNANGLLTWTLASVPPGATAQLTFDLQLAPAFPAGVTTLHAPAEVRSGPQVLATLDAASQVQAAPQLGASNLAVSREWAVPGQPLTYTITLSNTGNAPSAATWLTATLPADLVFVTSASMNYDPAGHRLTWQGAVTLDAPVTLLFNGAVSSARSACGQLDVGATARDELGQTTALAAAVQLAVPDVDCDGVVDVVDIQQVTARWGAVLGDERYHPRYDLDGDDVIDVQDIILAASTWQ